MRGGGHGIFLEFSKMVDVEDILESAGAKKWSWICYGRNILVKKNTFSCPINFLTKKWLISVRSKYLNFPISNIVNIFLWHQPKLKVYQIFFTKSILHPISNIRPIHHLTMFSSLLVEKLVPSQKMPLSRWNRMRVNPPPPYFEVSNKLSPTKGFP